MYGLKPLNDEEFKKISNAADILCKYCGAQENIACIELCHNCMVDNLLTDAYTANDKYHDEHDNDDEKEEDNNDD